MQDEYTSAAEWSARRGYMGRHGTPLPPNLSASVLQEINDDPEAFERRCRECAYADAMNRHANTSD